MCSRSALIVVDFQNDFVTGSLGLESVSSEVNCSSIISKINLLVNQCPFEMIVYTLDWHPEDHISFIENVHLRKVKQLNNDNQLDYDKSKSLIVKPFDCVKFIVDGVERKQIVYPKHCVQSTWGSQLVDELIIPNGAVKIYKGTNPDVDSYSAFKDNESLLWTQLDQQLREKGITDVYICGIAYDICVYYTIKDSMALNYRTIMIEDCCKGTNQNQINQVRQQLIKEGCLIINADQVKSMVSQQFNNSLI